MIPVSLRLARITLGLCALLAAVPMALAAPATPVIQVAAAADLSTCLEQINAGYAAQPGSAAVKASIGASGNFYAQIRNGAPYDVFLSADMLYPRELVKAGLADAGSLFVYAHGRLVMWSNVPGLDLSGGFRVLADPRVTRIAIANPDVAPYGRAAKAAIMHAGLWEQVKHKLVFGENVAQTAQFIETGNAQVGLISSAQLNAPQRSGQGRSWPVPPDSHPLMEQGAIVTAKGRASAAARAYLDYLRSEAGRTVLRKCGFALPQVGR